MWLYNTAPSDLWEVFLNTVLTACKATVTDMPFESVLTKVYFVIILGNQGAIHSVPTAFMNAVGTEWITPELPRMFWYKLLSQIVGSFQ